MTPDPDLFRTGGLTPAQLQIFLHLSAERPVGVRYLVDTTGIGSSTVYKGLKRLKTVGLAFQGPDGWTRLAGSPEELLEVQHALAREVFCTAGATERQRHRYELERSLYRKTRGPRVDPQPAGGEFGPVDELTDVFDRVWHRLHCDPATGILWMGAETSGWMPQFRWEQLQVFHALSDCELLLGSSPGWLAERIVRRHIRLDDLSDEDTIYSFIEESWHDQVGRIQSALSRVFDRQLSPEEANRVREFAVEALSQGIPAEHVEYELVDRTSAWEGFELVHRDMDYDCDDAF